MIGLIPTQREKKTIEIGIDGEKITREKNSSQIKIINHV